jgi:hypothetical protein
VTPDVRARKAQTAQRSPSSTGQGGSAPVRFLGLRRALILIAATLIAINFWTGAPLAALWIGSRVLGRGPLTMTAVFVVIAALTVLLGAMALALTWLSARYDELIGRATGERRTLPWLRSMRAEEADLIRKRRGTTALETIVVANTVTAVIALEIWFFFFAKNPLPG